MNDVNMNKTPRSPLFAFFGGFIFGTFICLFTMMFLLFESKQSAAEHVHEQIFDQLSERILAAEPQRIDSTADPRKIPGISNELFSDKTKSVYLAKNIDKDVILILQPK